MDVGVCSKNMEEFLLCLLVQVITMGFYNTDIPYIFITLYFLLVTFVYLHFNTNH